MKSRIGSVCLLLTLLLGLVGQFLNVDLVPMVGASPADIEAQIIGFSTATNGTSCTFRTEWNTTGSHYIFGTDNSGSWQNETAQACSESWTNTTKILTSTADSVVQWRYWINDTNGDWTSISVQNLTTVSVYSKGAVTGSASDIDDAVDDVASGGGEAGGNVYVPTGTFDWYNTQVAFSHDNISIIGAGIDVTIINQTKQAPFTDMFYPSDCEYPRISSFTLNGLIVSEGSPYDSVGIRVSNCENYRVDHCKFIDFAEASVQIRSTSTSDPCYGVIDHCTILNPYKEVIGGSWADGIDIRSNAYSPSDWDNNITNFLAQYPVNQTHPLMYIEDCVTHQTRHAVTSGQLGWFVIRHNTFYQNNSNSIIDIHGGYVIPPDVCGGRGLECYDNVMDHLGTGGWGVCTRGGDGVMFNNTMKNSQKGIELTLDSADDPKPTSEMWIWNNTFQSVSTNFTYNEEYFTEDEDFFLRAPNLGDDGFEYTHYTYPHPLTEEETAPTYSNVGFNTTLADEDCEFSVELHDSDGNVSGYIFSTNNTGSYQNETWASIGASEGWGNVTKTLNSTVGVRVRFIWYFNDTDNLWSDTGYWSFITSELDGGEAGTVTLIAPDEATTQTSNQATFQYLPEFQQTPQNASLWLNITGTWQVATWNSTTVTANITNSITFNFGAYSSATYLWTVRVYNTTHGIFATTNRTINVQIDPTYEYSSYNVTTRSEVCEFSAVFSDTDGLSGCILGSNNTGQWANQTWTAFSDGEVDWVLTLNETVGAVLQYRFWGNDSDNHWVASQLESFTITNLEFATEAIESYNTALSNSGSPYILSCTRTITYLFYANNQLTLKVNASFGTTSVTTISSTKGEPISVSGATTWSYSGTTITVNVLHSSEQEVIIDWTETIPEALTTLIRNNYYLVLTLMSIGPILLVSAMIIGMVKEGKSLSSKDITALFSLFVLIILTFIIIFAFMNATIGG